MASPSVSTDLAAFSAAGGDSLFNYTYVATDWTLSNVTPSSDTDYMVEGNNCLSAKLSKSGTTVMTADFILSAASLDLTNKNIYMWFLCLTPALLESKANGGMRIRIMDSSNNWGEWYIDGYDTYPGGWQCYCINTATAFQNKSATSPTISLTKKVGFGVRQQSGANKTNFFWDAWRYGTGLTLTLGDSSTPGTIEDFYTTDNASKYGVVRKFKGVYLVQGGGSTTRALTIGSTGSAATYFSDSTGAVVVFLDNPAYVAPTGATGGVLYDNAATPAVLISPNGLKIVGNASANTEVYLTSTVFKAENKRYRYYVTVSDTNVTKFTFSGVSFQDSDTITGQAYNANQSWTNCTFARCNRFEPSTGTVTGCTFSSAPGRALLISSASHNVTSCTFQSCGVAIDFSTATTYSLSGCTFSGNTRDVINTSGGSVTVNATSCTGLTTDFTSLTANNVARTYDTSGGTYTSEDTAAFNATPYDMNILSDADPEVNDAYYFGNTAAQFTSLLLRQEIAATASWTITWEYWNGAWTALTSVTDGTTGFTVTSPTTKRVTWTAPGDWVTTSVNSTTAYWIRARISAYTSRTTAPKGTQAWLETTDATTINTTVTLLVTCKNAAGNAIEGVSIRIEKVSDGSLISEGETDASGEYEDSTYNYPGADVAVKVIARMKGYKWNDQQTTIKNTGMTAGFTMVKDPAVNLP